MRVAAVVNPASAGGKAGRQWSAALEPVARELFPDLTVRTTEGPGHATALTRELLGDGVELVLSVGGDGTLHEVVNGFFDDGGIAAAHATVAPVPAGTGGDFCRTLGLARDPAEALHQIAHGVVRPCDVGRITLGDRPAGYFVNIADLGMGGALVERLTRASRAMGGFLTYLWHLLAVLATYEGKRVAVRVDGAPFFEGPVSSVVVANGRYFGSGMHVAPKADIASGVFEVVIIESASKLATLRSLPRMYQGRLEGHPSVHITRGAEVEVGPADGLLLDVDGEYVGAAPVRFTIVPHALAVRA